MRISTSRHIYWNSSRRGWYWNVLRYWSSENNLLICFKSMILNINSLSRNSSCNIRISKLECYWWCNSNFSSNPNWFCWIEINFTIKIWFKIINILGNCKWIWSKINWCSCSMWYSSQSSLHFQYIQIFKYF